MQTIEHLRGLFAYNDWANRRIIAALKEDCSEKSLKILAHLLLTEQEYFERLYGKDSTGFNFWPNFSIQDCSDLAKRIAENYETLLKKFDEDELGLSAKYKTSEGVPHENDFRGLLTHVLIHSATHRGNIVLKLREEAFEPPKIDYIIYLRENFAP